MNRFPSPVLRVSFEGPDLREETLYELLRVRTPSPPLPSAPSPLTLVLPAVWTHTRRLAARTTAPRGRPPLLHRDLQQAALRRGRAQLIARPRGAVPDVVCKDDLADDVSGTCGSPRHTRLYRGPPAHILTGAVLPARDADIHGAC